MSFDISNATAEDCMNFHKEFMDLWETEVEKSGKSPEMYVMMNKEAAEALYLFNKFRVFAKEKHNIEFLELISGVTITDHTFTEDS